MDYSQIRLVIWDLDNTLWDGILSEESVSLKPKIKDYLIKSTQMGIINSINSLNEYNIALNELKRLDIDRYFVYSDIALSSKGNRIYEQINSIGISADYVLFIDDNDKNLDEALFYVKNLHTLNAKNMYSYIDYILDIENNVDKSSQLLKYKGREKRDNVKATYDSNIEFLRHCEIKIAYENLNDSNMDRAYELIHKTNQLNFTKNRISLSELESLKNDNSFRTVLIREADKFGDNGIIGLYCLDKVQNKLIHFLFSCRMMNMGIEDYIFNKLDKPLVNVINPIAHDLDKFYPEPDWISEGEIELSPKKTVNNKHYLFKGPCDLKAVIRYFPAEVFNSELTYMKEDKQMVYQNSLANIYMAAIDDKSFIENEIKKLPFYDEDFYRTSLFDASYDGVVISFILLLNTAIYHSRQNDYFVGMGIASKPFFDKVYDEDYLTNGKYSYNFDNKIEQLEYIRANYKYLNPIEYVDKYMEQHLKAIVDKIKAPKIVFLLGNEMPFMADTKNKGIEMFRHMNVILRKFADKYENIYLINPNEFIHSEANVGNSLNHYTSEVYFKIAIKLNEILQVDGNIDSTIDTKSCNEGGWQNNEFDYK